MSNTIETFEIEWENKMIYTDDIRASIVEFLDKNIEGGLPLYSRELKRYNTFITESPVPISLDVLQALRYIIQKQRGITIANKIHFYVDKIKEKFISLIAKINEKSEDAKLSVINFYASIRVPIYLVLSIIKDMEQYKELSDDILKLLFQPLKDNEIVDKQMKEAEEEYKNKIIKWLKEGNVELTINSGKPDIIFDTPIEIKINNTLEKVYWMETSNYALFDLIYIKDYYNTRSVEYNQKYGFGAFVFKYGLDPLLEIPGALVLDGSFTS